MEIINTLGALALLAVAVSFATAATHAGLGFFSSSAQSLPFGKRTAKAAEDFVTRTVLRSVYARTFGDKSRCSKSELFGVAAAGIATAAGVYGHMDLLTVAAVAAASGSSALGTMRMLILTKKVSATGYAEQSVVRK